MYLKNISSQVYIQILTFLIKIPLKIHQDVYKSRSLVCWSFYPSSHKKCNFNRLTSALNNFQKKFKIYFFLYLELIITQYQYLYEKVTTVIRFTLIIPIEPKRPFKSSSVAFALTFEQKIVSCEYCFSGNIKIY